MLFSGSAAGSSGAPYEAVVSAQISGRVIDSVTGAPVAAATVRIGAGGLSKAADEDGRFAFGALPAGSYDIQVSAVGYVTRTIEAVSVSGDQPKRLVIELAPTSYPLESGRTVTASRLQAAADGVIRLDRQAIENSRAGSLPELLERVPGVYIQQHGPGGQATVRIRGSDPKQVLVLVDGVKLNASGSGVADLSTVPLAAVESIEIHTGGGAASFGPEALAGAVKITTRPSTLDNRAETDLGLTAGRWARRDYRFSVHNPLPVKKLEQRFGIERLESDGDFGYRYEADGVSGQSDTVFVGNRTNNGVQSTSLYGVGMFRLSRKTDLSYSVQHFEAERGLPGPIEEPDSAGLGTDRRLLVTAAFAAEAGRRHSFETVLGFTQLEQQFVNRDPGRHVATHYDTRFLNEQLSASQQHVWRAWNRFRQRTALEVRRERLYHDDRLRPRYSMGRADRTAFGASWSAEQGVDIQPSGVFSLATFETAIRYDYAETESDRAATPISPGGQSHLTRSLSPRVGLVLTRSGALTYTVRMSYGKSLRLPEINALFWRGDARSSGNPDLRPERSEHSEIELTAARQFGPVLVTGGASYYHASVTDLVVWQPNFQGTWQPQNIGRAQLTGHEERLGLYAFGDLLAVQVQRATTEALNKQAVHTVNGRQLPFYPRRLTSVTAEVHYRGIEGVLQHRRADRTYTNEANTKSYAPYAVTDLRLAATVAVAGDWQATLRSSIENLTDEQYVLSAQYPMPGRQVLLGLTIAYSIGGSANKGHQ